MKSIATEKQYEKALARFEALMDVPDKERDNAEFEALSKAISEYEDDHYSVAPPPVAAALEFRMDQEGLTQAQVCRMTGISKSRISEILSGLRQPSREQIKIFHNVLGIPLQHLLSENYDCPQVELKYRVESGYPELSAWTEDEDGFDLDMMCIERALVAAA